MFDEIRYLTSKRVQDLQICIKYLTCWDWKTDPTYCPQKRKDKTEEVCVISLSSKSEEHEENGREKGTCDTQREWVKMH